MEKLSYKVTVDIEDYTSGGRAFGSPTTTSYDLAYYPTYEKALAAVKDHFDRHIESPGELKPVFCTIYKVVLIDDCPKDHYLSSFRFFDYKEGLK